MFSGLLENEQTRPSQRIDDFVEFQSIFMRMNRKIDAAEWPPFDQKRLSRFGPPQPN
jgi:hypothetical protein